MTIDLGPGARLDLSFVTKTCAILAQRRKGKTYTASVIAEELVGAGQPWVALDPTGAWWGLRSSADGQKAGLPVVIFGGHHGDVPLERSAGKFVAELVVDEPGWYVIDFSLFDSKEAERQFATDFAERLYRRKGRDAAPTPLHLFVDEADRFMPQRSPSGDQRMLGAFEALVRAGGLRGIGTTVISQRAAVVNKNVLEQIDLLITLRNVGPNDQAAIDKYIQAWGDDTVRKEMMGSLASLELGEAWLWEPGGEPALFQRVKVRARRTFNSSATPKAGEKRVEPRTLAAVDLEAIKTQMAETIERAKADDPKLLRKRITELERELDGRSMSQAPPEQVEVVVEVPTMPAELWDELNALATQAQHLTDTYRVDQSAQRQIAARPRRRELKDLEVGGGRTPMSSAAGSAAARRVPEAGGEDPGKSPRRILSALATHGHVLPKDRLALIVGMTATGGSYNRYLSTLRALGYATGSGEITITDAGLAWATDTEPLPTPGPELLDWWCSHRSVGKSPARILRALAGAGGRAGKEHLAELVDMTDTGGSFNRYLSTLRSLGLIEGTRELVLADELM